MASSSGFGSYVCYSCAINARFPYSSAPEGLSYAAYTHSPAHSSIGTLQRNKSAATLCKYAVSVLFHSPLGVLFTFPSRYLFAIGHRTYVALPVSSGRFTRAIRVSSYSRKEAKESGIFRLRGHYPLGRCFPAASAIHLIDNSSRTSTTLLPYNPPFRRKRFGLFPFRSPLLGE
jgi:hypothetical protein